MDITYRKIGKGDEQSVIQLMHALYEEDKGGKPMSDQKMLNTIEMLGNEPQRGMVMVLEYESEIIGYAILINFWSNEYGGNLVDINEFYIKKDYRSQGIGSGFIQWLADNKINDAVALQLEVTPNNDRARKLYERLGFKAHKNTTLDLELE